MSTLWSLWQHLSWSHALLVVLLAFVLLVAIATLLGKCIAHADAPAPHRDYPVADYSREYQKKVAWLGDRFLLAKPINRRSAS